MTTDSLHVLNMSLAKTINAIFALFQTQSFLRNRIVTHTFALILVVKPITCHSELKNGAVFYFVQSNILTCCKLNKNNN